MESTPAIMKNMAKHSCHICGNSYVKLARHMETKHSIYTTSTVPQNLKDFTVMCNLFPICADEWIILDKNKQHLHSFIFDGKDLPFELFRILYHAFERYKILKHKLAILEDRTLSESNQNVSFDYKCTPFNDGENPITTPCETIITPCEPNNKPLRRNKQMKPYKHRNKKLTKKAKRLDNDSKRV